MTQPPPPNLPPLPPTAPAGRLVDAARLAAAPALRVSAAARRPARPGRRASPRPCGPLRSAAGTVRSACPGSRYGTETGSAARTASSPARTDQPGPYGGHPAQPPYAGHAHPAGGGGGGNFFKGKTGVIVAAAVAVLPLVAGARISCCSGDEKDGKPSAEQDRGRSEGRPDRCPWTRATAAAPAAVRRRRPERRPARTARPRSSSHLQNETDLPRSGAEFFGPWTVGDTVVKGGAP